MVPLYYPDSVRSKDAGPKYVPVVRSHSPAAYEADDGWVGVMPFGETFHYESSAEAIAAVEAAMRHDGWITDYAKAERLAGVMAERRNGPICAALRKLRLKHKAGLHLVLGLSRGQDSAATVQAWILGRVKVPAEWLARWRADGLIEASE